MDQDATWYGGRPKPRGLCVRWEPSPFPKKGAQPPKFSAHIYCGQTAGWIKMVLGMEVGLSPGDFVLDGDPPPPQFSAHFYCGQTAAWITMPLGTEICLSPNDCVRCGPSSPPQKWGRAPPQFSTRVHSGQTAGWIKMALGMEVALGLHNIVLDGDPAPLPKRGTKPPPHFRPFLLWPNGWMHQDATLYGGRPQPGDFVLGGNPVPSPQKGAVPPNVRPTSIVAKRLHGSRCRLVRR